MHRILFSALLLSALSLWACGEDGTDGGGETSHSPVITSAALSCGPFAGEGDPKVEGDILLGIDVVASDEDGDLTKVTANYDGALLELTAQGENNFVYEQGGVFNEIARCSGEEEIVIRALDALGNVAEFKGDAIMR
jgi:hypothetical protein